MGAGRGACCDISIPSSPQRGSEGRVETGGSTQAKVPVGRMRGPAKPVFQQRPCGLRPRRHCLDRVQGAGARRRRTGCFGRVCYVAPSSACRHLLPEGRRDLRQPLRSHRPHDGRDQWLDPGKARADPAIDESIVSDSADSRSTLERWMMARVLSDDL